MNNTAVWKPDDVIHHILEGRVKGSMDSILNVNRIIDASPTLEKTIETIWMQAITTEDVTVETINGGGGSSSSGSSSGSIDGVETK